MLNFIRFFWGKTTVHPRQELLEKARGLSVSHSTSSCFLTKAESETAMATGYCQAARSDRHTHRCGTTQHFWRKWQRQWQEQPSRCQDRCRPWRQSALASPTDSALGSPIGPSVDLFGSSSSTVNNNNSDQPVGQLHPRRLPVASRVPLPPEVMVVVEGTRVNASCAYREWWCPYPTRHRS